MLRGWKRYFKYWNRLFSWWQVAKVDGIIGSESQMLKWHGWLRINCRNKQHLHTFSSKPLLISLISYFKLIICYRLNDYLMPVDYWLNNNNSKVVHVVHHHDGIRRNLFLQYTYLSYIISPKADIDQVQQNLDNDTANFYS